MDYNGWTNRETWLINLWFGDHWESQTDVDSTKDFCEEELDSIPKWILDFVDWNVINWEELKQSKDNVDE